MTHYVENEESVIIGTCSDGARCQTPQECVAARACIAENDAPLYEWDIEVRRLDYYGQRVESRTPAKVLASTNAEVTTKVRAMFGATHDDFRKFWSHTWALNSVQEVQRVLPATAGDEEQA